MRVIRDQRTDGGRIVVLGTFDGVHRGHRELLRQARQTAREMGLPLQVCTFDRHPLEIIRPAEAPYLLTTTREKLRLLAAAGVEETRLLAFTPEMARMEPEAFLGLLRDLSLPRAVFAGWNYTFGYRGLGNAGTLTRACGADGIAARVISPVQDETGTAISSTRIRRCLQEGRTADAERLLGRPYSLRGIAEAPGPDGTAALKTPARKLLPAPGTYRCLAELRGRSCRCSAVLYGGRTVLAGLPEDLRPEAGSAVSLLLGERAGDADMA